MVSGAADSPRGNLVRVENIKEGIRVFAQRSCIDHDLRRVRGGWWLVCDLIKHAHPLQKQIHPRSLEYVDLMHCILNSDWDDEVSILNSLPVRHETLSDERR